MEQKNNGSLSIWQKLGYGVGDFGANFCWTFVAAFIMIYCTNQLGVSAGVVGTLLLFSKVLDGITDVFMGSIIDRTHHPMGKARFWYFISAFPVAVFTYLIFNVPASFTDTTKYIYVFITYTLMGAVFYTMNNVAYSTLMALVSRDPRDRVQMGSFRYIFAILAGVSISYLTSGLVERFGGGQRGWRMVSLLYAVVCLVVLMIPVLSVRELPEDGPQEHPEPERSRSPERAGFLETFRELFQNKYFVLILLYYFFMYLFSGISSGLGVFYVTYCLHDPKVLGTISLASYIPTVVTLLFVAQITGRFGIRKSAFVGHLIALAGSIVALVGGLQGAVSLLLLGLVIRGFGIAPMSGSVNALIAATDDYSELKLGRRMTGTFFSCSSVGLKVGSGLGTAISGILLDLFGFKGELAVQSASTVNAIQWSYLLPNILFPLATLIILCFMNVEQDLKRLRQEKGVDASTAQR